MQVNSFSMHFEGIGRLELVRSEFRPSGTTEALVVIRGKTSGAYTRCGSFQWTSGVRAVCAAFIRFAMSEQNDKVDYCLIGGKGSLAASLDYALSKGPAWIGEMFGATPGGGLYAKRLFRITNPNRKRPGPVALSVNRSLIAGDGVQLFVNGRKVIEAGEMAKVLRAIEAQEVGVDEPAERSPTLPQRETANS
jgi:hypothetical protein